MRCSFRRLASDLGVTPMALYRYVDDKEALLDALGDLVLSELPEPPTGGHWQQAASRHAVRVPRRPLVAHAAIVPIFQSRPLLGPAGLRSANAVLGVFRRAGFSPEQAVLVYRQFVRFLLALDHARDRNRPRPHPRAVARAGAPCAHHVRDAFT